MSKLGAILGAAAAGTLALSMQARAAEIEITLDAGSQTSQTIASCTGFDESFAGNDCTYTDTSPNAFNPVWIGPQTRDAFFTIGEGEVFSGDLPVAGRINVALSGTLVIDDQGTADCADDTLAGGVITMAPFARSLPGSGPARRVEQYPNGLTQTLNPLAFATGTDRDGGGCDYTLGENGVPDLLQGPFGAFPGTAATDDWDAPSAIGITRWEGAANPGASASATADGYVCLQAPATNCSSAGFSFDTADKKAWSNIIGTISTDAGGNLVEAFLFLSHEFNTAVPGETNTNFTYTAELTGTCTDNCPASGPTPPAANDDSATVNQDQSVDINVLANDTNLTDPVTVTVTGDPSIGIAVVNGSPGAAGDISITYTPNAGESGSDSFTYTVTDENGSDSATVTITINQIGANDDTASTRLNSPVDIDVLPNDVGFTDPVTISIELAPGSTSQAVVVDEDGNEVAGGTGEQANLRIRFTPDAPLGTPTYTETFTYEVTSGCAPPAGANGDTYYCLSSVVATVPFGAAPATTFNQNATAVVDGDGNVTVNGVAFSSNNANATYNYSNGGWTTELGDGVDLLKTSESCTEGPGTSCTNQYNGFLGDWISGFDRDGTPTGPCTSQCTSAFFGEDLTGEPLSNVRVTLEDDVLVIQLRSRFFGDPANVAFFGAPKLDTFTFELPPPSVSDTAEVTVTVNNAVPVANDTTVNVTEAAARAVNPNTLVQQVNVGTLAGNSLGDAPAEVEVGTQTNGTATVSGNIVTVTPAETAFGGTAVTVEYTITDDDGEFDSGVITVNIPDVAPTLNDGSGSVQTGQSTTVTLAFTGGNGSVAQHTLEVTTQAASGSCALDGASVVYTAGSEAGTFSCVVTLADGDGDADTGTFTFTVTAPPAPSDPGIRLPGGSSSMDLLGLALLAGLPLLRRRRRLS